MQKLYEWAGGDAAFERLINAFYEHMLAKHRDLGIADEQRFRFASLMSLAADDAGLPDDPEFRSALVAYLEWGTRLAVHNSQPGAGRRAARAGPALGLGRGPTVRAMTRATDAVVCLVTTPPDQARRSPRRSSRVSSSPA